MHFHSQVKGQDVIGHMIIQIVNVLLDIVFDF